MLDTEKSKIKIKNQKSKIKNWIFVKIKIPVLTGANIGAPTFFKIVTPQPGFVKGMCRIWVFGPRVSLLPARQASTRAVFTAMRAPRAKKAQRAHRLATITKRVSAVQQCMCGQSVDVVEPHQVSYKFMVGRVEPHQVSYNKYIWLDEYVYSSSSIPSTDQPRRYEDMKRQYWYEHIHSGATAVIVRVHPQQCYSSGGTRTSTACKSEYIHCRNGTSVTAAIVRTDHLYFDFQKSKK